jgi:hypothetical protein
MILFQLLGPKTEESEYTSKISTNLGIQDFCSPFIPNHRSKYSPLAIRA